MSTLDGREPRHWHDSKGRHRMPDPRNFAGYARQWWDADERGYVGHLEAHEVETRVPKPRPEDSDEIKALFEVISTAEQSIETSRALIRLKRAVVTRQNSEPQVA